MGGTCGCDTVRWLATTQGEQYVEVNYDLFRLPEQAQAVHGFVPRWNALGEPRPRLRSYFEEGGCALTVLHNQVFQRSPHPACGSAVIVQ